MRAASMLGLLNHSLFLRWRSVLAILVLAFAVYGVSVRYGFLEHDDDQHISHNPRMQTITFDGLKGYWQASYLGLYIPVTYTYWTAGVALTHLTEAEGEVPYAQPGIFHFSNILLHALNACLVYFLLRRFGAKDSASLVGALLFLLHPMQVEAVAWISGAKDLLSTFFALAAMRYYAKFLCIGSPKKGERFKPSTNYGIAFILFALAILAKPSTVILPLFFFFAETFAARCWRLASFLRVMPHLLAVAALLYFTGATQITEGPFEPVPLWLRPLVAGDSIIFYLRQLFFPLNFAVDYGRRPDLLLSDHLRLGLATWPYVLGGVLLWNYRHKRLQAVTAAYALFVVGLLPTLGFMQFAYAFFSLVCDRYAYLAMVGGAVLAATAFHQTLHYGRARLAVASVALLCLAVQSARLTRTWATEATLFGHSVEVEPNGSVALVALSNDLANNGHWAETIPLLERASQALPNWGRPYNNLGTTYLNLGKNEEAAAKYRQALSYFPQYPLAHSNLCAVLAGMGQFPEAAAECQAALNLAPEFDMPLLNLGYILAKLGRMADAEAAFRRAVELAPGSYKARRNLTLALKAQHKCDEALKYYKTLAQDYPKDEVVVNDLAACLGDLGRNDEAAAVLQNFQSAKAESHVETVQSSLDQQLHK